jgi:hypothetical protein
MARKVILAATLLIAALLAYACIPRNADLRAFDPDEMARLETAMWRDYYDKRYPALFYHLYESSRAQFGFSPLLSLRIALAAAEAAKTFQPTKSRREADAALPYLVSYSGLLKDAASPAFDVEAIARSELDWWQQRREAIGPREYGRTVALVAALTYGKPRDDTDILAFGILRAEAMAYRDVRGQAMTDQDWLEVDAQLRKAYRRLRAGIGG